MKCFCGCPVEWPKVTRPQPEGVLNFDHLLHKYSLDGDKLVSVTQSFADVHITDPSVYQGFEYARERGIAVHAATEMWDKGTLDEASVVEEVATRLEGYKLFVTENKWHNLPGGIEKQVFSRRFGLAGTIDRIGHFEGERRMVVLDIKTSKQSARWWKIQTAAYRAMWCASSGFPLDLTDRASLQVFGNSTYKLNRYVDEAIPGLPSDGEVVEAIATLVKWKRRFSRED